MADQGVSTQNFLRLLLGGMQRGTDVFQNRQTMQQQQAPDLMLTLQQMMQRKQMADQELNRRDMEFKQGQENWKKSFDAQQAAASQARAERGNETIYNVMKDWRERTNASVLQRAELAKQNAMMKYYESLAGKADRSANGGKSDAAQTRLSVEALLDSAEKADENYDYLTQAQFNQLDAVLQSDFSQHFATERDEGGNPINVVRYRRLRPGAAREIAGYKAILKQLAGLEEPTGLSTAPANTFPMDEDNADAYFQSLYDKVNK